ncbi:hypothetical protein IV203_000195 [Nitzschia inconspicua]|uniref:Uncharacterized protein n=1 Tax=Nitzschia inconspicua TaxID=303405 RepID=A0A9K3L539_9STRA|nr:hypothetical protein IV203_000195 [Nitzschia inconspicua]
MNAYSVGPKGNSGSTKVTGFHPFDQWSAIESIKRAKRYAPPQLEVDFVCAMFEEDRRALPDLPCRVVPLNRSTASEYQFLNTPTKPAKVLPFLQDILDAAMQQKDGQQDDEGSNVYLMLTNSDIAVTKYFYQKIWPHLTTREAFSVNRLSIPSAGINESVMFTHGGGDELLSYVDTILDKGQIHTGYDCFIMHSSVLQRFHLGEMFAGHPPWGTAMHMTLRIMSRNYTNISSNVNGTFHFGNDRSNWLPKGANQHQETFPEIEKQMHRIGECPVQRFGDHPYTYLNTINCGKWFRYNRFYDNHTIPNFVKHGYEKMYLQNYPNVLRYSSPNGFGKPLLLTKSTTQKIAHKAKVEAEKKERKAEIRAKMNAALQSRREKAALNKIQNVTDRNRE